MGRSYGEIDDRLRSWLERQPVFFVATAPLDPEGHVNLSPKGNRGELAVLDPHTVAYLEQTGSGIETTAHLRDDGRIVLMACAFDGPPRIVRLHGRGHPVRPGQAGWDEVAGSIRRTGGDPGATGVRGAIVISVGRIADSCGYGVPLMAFDRHRDTMERWAERKGADGVLAYQAEKNRVSIDGLPGLA